MKNTISTSGKSVQLSRGHVIRNILLIVMLGTSVISTTARQADTSTGKTILFEVTHPDTRFTSYLFGTHHAFGKSFFDSLENADRCLASCNVFIKENLNVPGHMAEDIINGRTEETNWEQYLNKTEQEYIAGMFASSQTDYRKMTPAEMHAFLNRHYSEQVCLGKEAGAAYASLDDYIEIKAESHGLEIVGLETTEEQIELINKDVEGMPRKVHRKRLSALISKLSEIDPKDCQSLDWYGRMEVDYRLDEPCRNALILTDRNAKWMATIEKYLSAGNCFIAVGLSHLMYECGLISQLRAMGYEVREVDPW